MRGSPVCVSFCASFGTFFSFLLRRLRHFCCCAAARCMNSVCAFRMSSRHIMGCPFWALWLFEVNDTNNVMVWLAWCRHCGNLPFETGWQGGISVDGLIGIKGEKDELLYTPTSFLVSLGEQDEAYLEHQQIFCSRRFLFLNDNKTHLIYIILLKSVRKIIKILKLGSSSCQEGAYCSCVGNRGTLWEGVLCVLIGLSKVEESVVSISLVGIWKRNMECTRCEWSFLVTTDFDPIQCFGNSRLPWFFVNDVVVTTDFDPNYG
ncbi:hypothetical protein BDC45DRAFT_538366 [Circinella umbellata]|nr:hypothetical protein BDC45DRAFT_538366 [Circinella umbellata]